MQTTPPSTMKHIIRSTRCRRTAAALTTTTLCCCLVLDQCAAFAPVVRPMVQQQRLSMVGGGVPNQTNTAVIDVTRSASATATAAPSTQPTPALYQNWRDHLGGAAMTRTMATAALGATVALSTLLAPADAAMSGGRMGGSFSAPSSRSMPSRSSYSGGSRSSSFGSSYDSRYAGGYRGGGSYGYGRGPTIIAPIVTTPGYGYGAGYGAGVGAISYNRGPGLFDLLFLGGLGWFALTAASGALKGRNGSDTAWSDFGSSTSSTTTALGTGVSVLRLTVALDVPNRDSPNSLLSALDRLAATASTDSRQGVQTLTSQVALELLRRKSSIQSASSTYKHLKDDTSAQRLFNQWSVEQRSKFEQETVSKFGGMDTSAARTSNNNANSSDKATMAVVTLVLSIAGDSTAVDKIRSLSDVEGALRKIAADVKVDDCLTGAEILWTPQDRSETLSRQNVVADYPELNTL